MAVPFQFAHRQTVLLKDKPYRFEVKFRREIEHGNSTRICIPLASALLEAACCRQQLVALPASPPTPATPTTAAHQPKQQKKHHRANEGVDDQGNDPGAKMDANPRQQPIADKRADQANNQVTDQSKAAAFHDSAGEPSGDNADDQDDKKTLIGQIHGRPQA
jgi:hypothetical protein